MSIFLCQCNNLTLKDSRKNKKHGSQGTYNVTLSHRKTNDYYIQMRVCSLIYPASNAHALYSYCHRWPARFYTVFTLSHKDTIFEKKVTYKMPILIFYTYFIRKIFHSKRKSARYAQKMYIGPRLQNPLLSDCNETWIFWTDFRKYSLIKFHLKNPSSESRVSCGQMDRRTDKIKLTVAWRNFANAHYNKWFKFLWLSTLTQCTGGNQNFT
jgi:hypothetical protein